MKASRNLGQELLEILTVLSRWGIGAFFIYSGFVKAMHPVEFLKIIRQYEMVSNPFVLNSIASALPWFEVFCGLLLVLGVAVRGTVLMILAMLIPFTLAVLKRALAIHSVQALAFCAIKFDCGCGTGEEYICHKLVQNCGLILLAAWLLAGRGRQFSLKYDLLKGNKPEPIPAPETAPSTS
jgi:uncharacterized membrane protein YphA (DoxX/SURF4 family)